MNQPTTPRTDPGNSRSFAAALQTAVGAHTLENPYLGDPTVVESLVRAFFSEELQRGMALGEGTTDTDTAQGQSLAGIARMARIFTGADKRYTALAGWNTAPALQPSHTLTDAIRARLGELVAPRHLEEPYSAATALFSVALLEYRGAIKQWQADDNDAAFQAKGEELADNYTRLLIGQSADDNPS